MASRCVFVFSGPVAELSIDQVLVEVKQAGLATVCCS